MLLKLPIKLFLLLLQLLLLALYFFFLFLSIIFFIWGRRVTTALALFSFLFRHLLVRFNSWFGVDEVGVQIRIDLTARTLRCETPFGFGLFRWLFLRRGWFTTWRWGLTTWRLILTRWWRATLIAAISRFLILCSLRGLLSLCRNCWLLIIFIWRWRRCRSLRGSFAQGYKCFLISKNLREVN